MAMDPITSSLLSDFIASSGLEHETDITRQFEYFANYCVVTNSSPSSDFEYTDIATGDNAPGIDGMAIMVNNQLVSSTEDIDSLINANGHITVRFIAISVKTTAGFNTGFISNLFSNVQLFFGDNPGATFNTPEMENFLELKDYIYSTAIVKRFTRNPDLLVSLVTLGSWDDSNEQFRALVGQYRQSLQSTMLFNRVDFRPYGAAQIQMLYRKAVAKIENAVTFDRALVMYDDNDKGEESGYIGVLPFGEYRKLLLNDDGNVLPVFEDNVRGYLGDDNEVNSAIAKSITEGDANAFCQKNNGVTIVASSVKRTGNQFVISDYQIVNGCQTSNTLIANRDKPNIDKLLIPIRLIVTKDESLKIEITRATNSQNAVKREQLESLSGFQRKLEQYYGGMSNSFGKDALVYQRREGQYRGTEYQNSPLLVTIAQQIKAYAAMYVSKPHEVSGRYGVVLRKMGKSIFQDTDPLAPYYLSVLALKKFEALLGNGIDRRYRKCRYHVLMLMRTVIDMQFSDVKPKKRREKSDAMITAILQDPTASLRCFRHIADYIASQAEDIEFDNRKCFERKETTEKLLKSERLAKLEKAIREDSAIAGCAAR